PLPAETAYAPFSKKVRDSGIPQTDYRVTESPPGSPVEPLFCPLSDVMLLKVHDAKNFPLIISRIKPHLSDPLLLFLAR
ncbi:hypothetical protein, partial [Pantoea sp. S62]|uniref:hypothetical protein n=1 Tax=Pantoea sp. S62 TaxID=2769342 RepID=UPI001F32A001